MELEIRDVASQLVEDLDLLARPGRTGGTCRCRSAAGPAGRARAAAGRRGWPAAAARSCPGPPARRLEQLAHPLRLDDDVFGAFGDAGHAGPVLRVVRIPPRPDIRQFQISPWSRGWTTARWHRTNERSGSRRTAVCIEPLEEVEGLRRRQPGWRGPARMDVDELDPLQASRSGPVTPRAAVEPERQRDYVSGSTSSVSTTLRTQIVEPSITLRLDGEEQDGSSPLGASRAEPRPADPAKARPTRLTVRDGRRSQLPPRFWSVGFPIEKKW